MSILVKEYSDELTKTQKPLVPEKWDYEESVKKIKSFIFKWKNMTSELLSELWIAREILSKEGRPIKTDANAPVKTWADYCEDTGIDKPTANRWLHAFQIGSDKVLLSKNLEWWIPRKHINAIN